MLGWTAEIVRHPKKLAPEGVMRAWVREFNKEGVAIDLEKLMAQKGPRPFLPKRWIVERTFAWLGQNRRMSKDYEWLPESGEAFIYVAMSRLMARRLARARGFSDGFKAKFAEFFACEVPRIPIPRTPVNRPPTCTCTGCWCAYREVSGSRASTSASSDGYSSSFVTTNSSTSAVASARVSSSIARSFCGSQSAPP